MSPAPQYVAPAIQWHSSYQDAIRAGTSGRKSIIIFFSSPVSGPSQKMEMEILANAAVKSKLSQSYVCCKLDVAKDKQVADYYSVFKAPVLVFLDSRGYSRARVDNLISASQLLSELDRYR